MKSFSFCFLLFFVATFSLSVYGQTFKAPANYAFSKKMPSLTPFKDSKTNLYGYKNVAGELVVKCVYAFASRFSEGYAAVNKGGKVSVMDEFSNDFVVNGGKWGYINEAGTLVIPLQFDAADVFESGFAIVESNGKKAFIDVSGKKITDFVFDYVNPFAEGLAVVGGGDPLVFSYIDTTGKVVITDGYSDAGDFSKGRARVTRYGATFFINTKGQRMK